MQAAREMASYKAGYCRESSHGREGSTGAGAAKKVPDVVKRLKIPLKFDRSDLRASTVPEDCDKVSKQAGKPCYRPGAGPQPKH